MGTLTLLQKFIESVPCILGGQESCDGMSSGVSME